MIRQSRNRGMTLIELLLALAISAALLTAAALAIDASFKAYRINQEQASLSQRARVALNQMLTTIRANHEHSPITASAIQAFASGAPVSDSGVKMYDAAGVVIVFWLDRQTGRLMISRDAQSHTLLNGVSDFRVELQPMKSPAAIKTGSACDLLKRANLHLTIRSTDDTSAASETTSLQHITLDTSVCPRQNVW